MSKKFPVIPSVICFAAVIVLCGLGTWQVERLQWKNELQKNLDAAFAIEHPATFTDDQLKNIGRGQVVRGRLNGQLDVSKAILVQGRIENGKSIVAVVAPLSSHSSSVTVSVELGCGDPKAIGELPVLKPKDVSITGVLRQPRWSFATPPNIPEKNEWWRLDAVELASYWNIPHLEKTVITSENTLDFGSSLWPSLSTCPIEKTLRNDHASYAFFWFTMAGVLSVIWGIRFLKPYLQSA